MSVWVEFSWPLNKIAINMTIKYATCPNYGLQRVLTLLYDMLCCHLTMLINAIILLGGCVVFLIFYYLILECMLKKLEVCKGQNRPWFEVNFYKTSRSWKLRKLLVRKWNCRLLELRRSCLGRSFYCCYRNSIVFTVN